MSDIVEKIKSLEELAELTAQAREKGLRVALCHGVFDLLHPGHIRYFEAARRVADLLVVTLVADEHVNKGPGRPVFNQRLRAESVAALQAVDYVTIIDSPTAVNAILTLRPHYYVLGTADSSEPDEAGRIAEEKAAIQAVGGYIQWVDDIKFSSTRLLNRYFAPFSQEAAEFLRYFRRQYSAQDVIERLKDLWPMKVLVIGDIILDEYHYCEVMGKSSKSPTLTARFLYAERYAGGALAVANHIAGYASQVYLVAFVGEPAKDEVFIRSCLKPNIQAYLVRHPGRPTVIKRRYVTPFQLVKMFEVCWLDSRDPDSEAEDMLLTQLESILPKCDLVVVADFGHGGVGGRTIRWLTQQPVFLAVNAQTNSANTGYNLITKYPRADYICIDEEELRLANRSRYGSLAEITERTAQTLGCRIASITLGARGSLTYHPERGMIHTPVFSSDVVDSVGAGDAYLSITSLCVRAGYPPELIGFVGNCVGALAVRIVGNRESVEPGALFSFISTLLK